MTHVVVVPVHEFSVARVVVVVVVVVFDEDVVLTFDDDVVSVCYDVFNVAQVVARV